MQTNVLRDVPSCALVAGATGLIGQALTRQLETDRQYTRLLAFSRRPLAVPGRCETLSLDTTPELGSVPAVFFCALGTTRRKAGSAEAFRAVDVALVLALARRARDAGVDRAVVISSVGAAPRATSFYLRCKAEMEAGLATLGFAAVHILRPSLLLGPRNESRPAERMGQWLSPVLAPALRGRWARYRPVHVDPVAARMRALARSPQAGLHIHHFWEGADGEPLSASAVD